VTRIQETILLEYWWKISWCCAFYCICDFFYLREI